MQEVVHLEISKESINQLIVQIIGKNIPAPDGRYFDIVSDFINRLNLYVAVNGITKKDQSFFFQEDEPEAFTLYSTMLYWQQYVEENHPKIDLDLASILRSWNSRFYSECMKVMYASHDYFRDISFN